MIGSGWTRRVGAVLMTMGLAACGGDDGGEPDPLLGIFEITSQTLSEMGCDAPMPLVDPSSCFGCVAEKPFFKVKRQTFFGSSFLSVVDCDNATTCDDDEDDPDTVDLGGAILERKEGGAWVGNAYAASYGGASCSYQETEWRLEENGEGVTLTRTVLRATPESPSGMLMDDACLDLTDNPPPRDELECDALETVEATAAVAM